MKTDYLKILKAFVSKDELKQALMGVFYDASENVFVATDGHKLVKITNRIEITNHSSLSVIIPLFVFEMFYKYEQKYKRMESYVHSLKIEDGRIAIMLDDELKLQEKLINEQYPDFNAVIPKERQDSDANVGINFDYMSGVASAFKQGCAPHFRLNIGSNISPLLMYPYMFDEMHSTKTTILIMPVRI